MASSAELTAYLARARKLLDSAESIDAADQAWRQRGCKPETVTLVAAIPSAAGPTCMLILRCTCYAGVAPESYCLAMYGADQAELKVYAGADMSRPELIAYLESKGLALWAIEELGIEVPRAPVVYLAEVRNSRAAATA